MDLFQNIPYYWTELLDSRVADLPLVASSYQVPLIILAYLYFVLSCGPRFMKNRPPYSLKTFIKLYDIVQILGNAWLTYEFVNVGVFSSKLVCPTLNYSCDYIPMRVARDMWYFFLLKILDYIETVVFVLRKKDNQISNLHLYHHVSTLLWTWLSVRYYAVSAVGFTSMLNSFIHTIMYTYYFLTTWGPDIQKAVVPIKQWITTAQMIQFIVLILYVSQQLIPGCKFVNTWVVTMFIGNVAINYYMFHTFYKRTYKDLKKT